MGVSEVKKSVAVSALVLVISAALFQPAFAGDKGNSKGRSTSTVTVTTPAKKATPASCHATTAVSHAPIKFAIPNYKAPKANTTFTFKTNCGDVVVQADGKNAPVTVFILATMARAGYYDQSLCHRLTTAGIFVLQCGDPTANGSGGPNFTFRDENLPASSANNYPAGTLAMANSGANTNGSQFFFVYADTTLPPSYTVWGRVTKGLDIVKSIALQGTTNGTGDGTPKQTIAIESVSVK